MVQWTDRANAKLLKAIIKKAKLTKQDYEYLAEIIGDGCTPKAVSNHIYRLMNGKGDDMGDGAVTPDSTPKKQAKSKPSTPAKSPKVTKRKQVDLDQEQDDDTENSGRELYPTPKKIKAEEKTTVKLESEEA
ncbi:hypothetical protein VTO42DRAFT_3299 [Malbranchea cinnamomea]